MGVNKRSTIKADIPQEIQTGSPFKVSANVSFEIKNYLETIVTSVPSLSVENIYIYAPSGKNARVTAVHIAIPPVLGSTAGTHEITLYNGTSLAILEGESVNDVDIIFNFGFWRVANIHYYPANFAAQAQVVRSIRFSDTLPLHFLYTNDTDVAQARDRTIELLVEEMNQ